jgi:hypothetical protein
MLFIVRSVSAYMLSVTTTFVPGLLSPRKANKLIWEAYVIICTLCCIFTNASRPFSLSCMVCSVCYFALFLIDYTISTNCDAAFLPPVVVLTYLSLLHEKCHCIPEFFFFAGSIPGSI